MKKTDIAMIILVISVSLLAAYFVMSAVLGKFDELTAEVQEITPIGATVVEPNPKIFNRDAINPTVQVIIGNESIQE